MKFSFKIITHSAAETKKAGKALGRLLKGPVVVALEGELGAGKTTLVKGIALGLGVADEKRVSSPTFVLMHEYQGREKIYHLDWYRLSRVQGVDADMARDCFQSSVVTLVEWPQRGKMLIPKGAIKVKLSHKGPEKRMLEFSLI